MTRKRKAREEIKVMTEMTRKREAEEEIGVMTEIMRKRGTREEIEVMMIRREARGEIEVLMRTREETGVMIEMIKRKAKEEIDPDPEMFVDQEKKKVTATPGFEHLLFVDVLTKCLVKFL